MDIILFGMQGSGKGTQGKILAEKYGLRIFEMGGELRRLVRSGSLLGQKIKTIIEHGDLVDDNTVMEVVYDFLKGIGEKKVLFDGIPRTITQSEKLLALLKELKRESFALLIEISKEEAMKRLTQRRICDDCKAVYAAFFNGQTCSECDGMLVVRHDDNATAIVKRLDNYHEQTLPVIDRFYKIDRLIKVDGERPIPDVTEEMIEKAAYLFE
jgi:adenylate kinase